MFKSRHPEGVVTPTPVEAASPEGALPALPPRCLTWKKLPLFPFALSPSPAPPSPLRLVPEGETEGAKAKDNEATSRRVKKKRKRSKPRTVQVQAKPKTRSDADEVRTRAERNKKNTPACAATHHNQTFTQAGKHSPHQHRQCLANGVREQENACTKLASRLHPEPRLGQVDLHVTVLRW